MDEDGRRSIPRRIWDWLTEPVYPVDDAVPTSLERYIHPAKKRRKR